MLGRPGLSAISPTKFRIFSSQASQEQDPLTLINLETQRPIQYEQLRNCVQREDFFQVTVLGYFLRRALKYSANVSMAIGFFFPSTTAYFVSCAVQYLVLEEISSGQCYFN